MNKLVKTVKDEDLTKEFLSALNGVLQLTGKQLEILEVLINIQPTLKPINGDMESVISSRIRKIVTEKTGVTSDNLSRHLMSFKRKGLLLPTKIQDVWRLNPAVVPELINDRVQITIILKTNGHKN